MGFFKDLKEDLSQAVMELMPDEEIIEEEAFEEEDDPVSEAVKEADNDKEAEEALAQQEDVQLDISNWMKKMEGDEASSDQGIGSLFADRMDEDTDVDEPQEESLEEAFKKAMSGLSGDDEGEGLNLFGSQGLFEESELPIPDIDEVNEELQEISKEPEPEPEISVSDVVMEEKEEEEEQIPSGKEEAEDSGMEDEIQLEVDDIPTPEELLAQMEDVSDAPVAEDEILPDPEPEEIIAEDEIIPEEEPEEIVAADEILPEPEEIIAEDEILPEPETEEIVAVDEILLEEEPEEIIAEDETLPEEIVSEDEILPETEPEEIVAADEILSEPEPEEMATEEEILPEPEPEVMAAEKGSIPVPEQVPVSEPVQSGGEPVMSVSADEEYLDSLLSQDAKQEDVFEKELMKEMKESNTDEVKEMADSNVTVITKGTKIDGSISADGSLEVYGVITGDVCCDGKLSIYGTVSGNSTAEEIFVNTAIKFKGNLTSDGAVKIGAETVVIGDVTGTSAVIAGAVKGEVDVNGPVVLDSTAVIKGNINAKTVQINSGAIVDGYCSLSYSNVDVNDIFDQDSETPNE